jgi:phage-related protein
MKAGKIFNRPLVVHTDGQDSGLVIDGLKHNVHTVAVNTNGTAAVNVIDAAGAPCAITIKAVQVTALDTTAGNITVQQGANTVCTIAKGTTGASSLSHTAYAKGDVFTVKSSSAGNATVLITFATA